jgi:hypothetical protein
MNADEAKPRGPCDARSRAASRRRRSTATALRFETLEARRVLSSLGAQAALDSPNETYDQALDLGDVGAAPAVLRHGALGEGEAGTADVVWYRFVLDRPGRVTSRLEGSQPGSSFRGVLSLFKDESDFVDITNPLGLRRLASDVADEGDGVAAIDRVVGPGTYDLAVSGAGNEFFSPIVADSGLPGSTGEFDLSLNVIDAGGGPSDGPSVLNSDPAPDAVLNASPFVIRVELSRPLDPSTIDPGRTVQLDFSPDGTFGGGGQAIPLASVNVSTSAAELWLTPASPLAPGYYRVVLVGNGDAGPLPLTGLDGTRLGTDSLHPTGRDDVLRFQVGGIEGHSSLAPADDTPAGATDLGELARSDLVQVEGAIGDDPFYNPANAPDPSDPGPLGSPGNDVDLYHFRVSGPGRFAFAADVFAGRIGSPLTPTLTLFRLNPATQTLESVDLNNTTYNLVPQSPGVFRPYLFDATMSGGIPAGDYYLAVTSQTFSGSFDPSVSHSYDGGFTTGPYVLNLLVRSAPEDFPRVADASLSEGQVLTEAPTRFDVTFDRAVNLPILLFQTIQQTSSSALDAVTIRGDDGTLYFPRLDSYDYATHRATFTLFDRLANGHYELRLSGAHGLSDLAGDPLIGNDDGGDYVISFTVDAPSARGQGSDPFDWTDAEPNDTLGEAQDLGTLFPSQLLWGTTVQRQASPDLEPAPSDTADVYRFVVLAELKYAMILRSETLPEGVMLTLRDGSGRVVRAVPARDIAFLLTTLTPGAYFVEVSGWGPDQAGDVSYQLTFTSPLIREDGQGNLSSPVPAVALALDGFSPPETSNDGGPGPVGGNGPPDDGGPPGHDAPGLPTAPASGGGILISGPPPSGTPLSFPPPTRHEPTVGPLSSTDLSVLAVQPVGSVAGTDGGTAVAHNPTPSGAAVGSYSPVAPSRVTDLVVPVFLGPSPAVPLAVVNGDVSITRGQGQPSPLNLAGLNGIILQAVVPWAPGSDRVSDLPPETSGGLGEQPPRLAEPVAMSQPSAGEFAEPVTKAPPLAAEREQGVVPEISSTEAAPTAIEDAPGTDLEPGRPVVMPAATLSEPADEAGLPPSWGTWLAIATLTSLIYLRRFKDLICRWSSRLPLAGRPGRGEPRRRSRTTRAHSIGETTVASPWR